MSRKTRKQIRAVQVKSVGRAPAWLKTVQIAKGSRPRDRGTFGAASPVVVIDPKTMEPMQ